MLKAQQELLAQEASNALIGIKNTEFQYYIDFSNSLGVMFAFIAGYQLSTINGTGPMDTTQLSYVYTETFQNLYWVLTVMSIFFSLEGLLVSVYLVVFGQALALQGPTGSVNKAIDILKRYQKHLLLTFSMTLITLGFATIAGFWYVMSWYGAAICSAVAVFGMFSWHIHTVQIYNAMKFIPADAVEMIDAPEPGACDNVNPMQDEPADVSAKRSSAGSRRTPSRASVGAPSGPEESALSSPFVSAWRSLTRGGRRKAFPATTVSETTDSPSMYVNSALPAANKLKLTTYSDANFGNIVLDSTIDLRVVKPSEAGRGKWARRYVVVTAHAMIMVYTNDTDYQLNAQKAVCRQFRPIDISDYSFKISDDGTGTDTTKSDVVTLSPVDNYMAAIEIKCLDGKDFKRLMSVIGMISKP